MSLFSRITKSSDKSPYPWSQRKLSGGTSSNAVPRFGHAATALQTEQLLIYGGYHKSPNKKDLFIVDTGNISVNTLNASGDIPPPRSFATVVSVGHHVLLYGGEPTMPDEKWDPHAYFLNISNKQWSRIRMDGHLPVERSRHSAVVADGVMYVWGGQRAGRYLNDLIAFDMNEYPSKSQWEFIVPTTGEGPSARAGHAAVIFDNKMYIFGGTDGDHLYNDIWAFDLQARAWAQVPAVGFIPVPRTDFAAAAVNGVMYVFGGRGPDGQDLGDLCAFKMRSHRWYMFQNMGPTPSARYGLSLTAVREKMFVIGGDASSGKLEDVSFAYILDSAKIRYPPEALIQTPPQATPPQEAEYVYQKGPLPSNIQNSQSTPVRSAPYPQNSQQHQHQHLHLHQQQQQQQQHPTTEIVSANHDMEASPPQLFNEPQSSASTPLPGNTNRTPPPSIRSNGSETSPQPTGKPRHASVIPEAVRRRTRTTSPMPFSEIDTSSSHEKYSDPTSPSSINSTDHDLPIAPQRSNMQYTDERQQHQQQHQLQQQQQQQQHATPRPSHARNTIAGATPPPRPSREGVDLGTAARYNIVNKEHNVIDDRPRSHMSRHVEAAPVRSASPHTMPNGRIHDTAANGLPPDRSLSPTHRQQAHQPTMNSTSPQPSALRPKSLMPSVDSPMQDEKANLLRELKAREMIITEMKKKEQWWRMEVSIARKMRAARGETFDDQAQTEEAMLVEFSDASPDKLKLFEQLIAVKSEIRRVKQSIIHQAQPMSLKVEQADRMRIAALQEAGYFKSKYHALKSQQSEELARIEMERAADLEKRLALAMAENDNLGRQLEQLQQRAQHDHASRLAAEERAKEAHERAQEAQEAHQRALDELAKMHTRATKAENQAREGALQIAELTHQLAQVLSSETSSHELSEAHLSISRLEAANLKARNEAASLRQRLAESMDEIARLRTLLGEREEALKEATRQLEDSDIQLGMMRDALSRKGIAINGIPASSKPQATPTIMGGF